MGKQAVFPHLGSASMHYLAMHEDRTIVQLCQTPFHMSFISLHVNSTFHILPPFSLLILHEWAMCCCSLQDQQSSSQRLPIPLKMALHTPTKTKSFPQLCCYVTTKGSHLQSHRYSRVSKSSSHQQMSRHGFLWRESAEIST